MNKELLTQEEIAYLSIAYIRLKQDPGYKKLSAEYRSYIEEFLDTELLKLKRSGYIIKEK